MQARPLHQLRLVMYVVWKWFYLWYLQLCALSFLKCVGFVCFVSIMQEAELYTDFVLCGCRFLNLTGGKKYNFCMFLSASEKNMLFFWGKKWEQIELANTGGMHTTKIWTWKDICFSASCHDSCETLGHIFFHFNWVQQNTVKYCSHSRCGDLLMI